jgi:anti-repressor protein
MFTALALVHDLRLRADGLMAVVNSRDVADLFEKEHRHVLRDIDALLHGSNLSGGWFREVRTEHPTVASRMDRSFDLTRDGFTLLVMGWTGKKAMQFKVRYIQAFNAMEDELPTWRLYSSLHIRHRCSDRAGRQL